MLPSLGIKVFEFKFEFSLSLSLLILCVCPFHIANTLPPPPPPPPPPRSVCTFFPDNTSSSSIQHTSRWLQRPKTCMHTRAHTHTHSLTHSHTPTNLPVSSPPAWMILCTSVNKTHSYLGLVPTVMRPCQPHSMECLTDGMRKSLWIRLSMLCIPFRRNSARPTCNM